jgi:hypothetical protein
MVGAGSLGNFPPLAGTLGETARWGLLSPKSSDQIDPRATIRLAQERPPICDHGDVRDTRGFDLPAYFAGTTVIRESVGSTYSKQGSS